jgi:hypothetical protein
MASDDKKTKTSPPSKNEAAPKNKSTSDVDLSKTEGGEPSGGEGQKPVSKAYKDNWNVIFAKKKSDSPEEATSLASNESCDGLRHNASRVQA